jgi:crotonobetainyl-CoA:carnitine CoA-transferase CaiB-like acyl-CoA transferase
MDHPQVRANADVIHVDDPILGPSEQLAPLVRMVLAAPDGDRPDRHRPLDEPVHAPLQGVTVVECAAMFAGPYASTQLADLGARVIKVEPLNGDLMRANGALAVKVFQGKESFAVDLKRPEGRHILHELVQRADLFVHNYRHKALGPLGIDEPTLRAVNPALVYLYAGEQ